MISFSIFLLHKFFSMLTPINLDNQFHFQRKKVHDVRPNGNLPPELDPKTPVFKATPTPMPLPL